MEEFRYTLHGLNDSNESNESKKYSNIINELLNKEQLQYIFKNFQKVKISNFLEYKYAEIVFQNILNEKSWVLATGIDKMKYEKPVIPVNDKINNIQLKNVNNAFGNDKFSYIFFRSMNGTSKMSYIEFTLRQTLNSKDFINMLNEITGMELKGLTTLFLSKYKSGNFLSPHSDKGNGRLAFVINLTKGWKPQYGGILHFMNEERNEIIDSYVPEFNSFVIFNVPEEKGIPHFVSHIAPNVKFNRYAITGWFN